MHHMYFLSSSLLRELGFEFIKEIPATWDETKVLNAAIGQYITLARRKGKDWYAGTISNHEARHLGLPLNFLDDGKYTADIYTDAKNTDTNPNGLVNLKK